jgi:membrane peptidoglycan carboxypeptidase
VYAQLTATVGPASVARMAHRLGVKSPLNPYLSIGLGAEAVNPLEMARAYATFAHGGARIDGSAFGNEPRAVRWVDQQTKSNGRLELLDTNRPVNKQVLDPAKNAVLTNILQTVIQSGTGRAAQLGGGWSTAGKTGTTENHGDAWFVGYTPSLVTAVWVGYPNELKPMLTQFHGDPVAGGTYPALIWKAFMLKALKEQKDKPTPFPSASGLYASPSYVVYRDGQLERDNGICKGAFRVWTFSTGGPARTADCRENEVQVPNLIGMRRTAAVSRLEAQPLKQLIVYKAARPRQWPNTVVAQIPRPLRRTVANDTVTLVLAKPLHGLVPRLIGLPLNAALSKLAKLKLSPNVRPTDAASSRRVLRQFPAAGVAAAPGMTVKLVVRGG